MYLFRFSLNGWSNSFHFVLHPQSTYNNIYNLFRPLQFLPILQSVMTQVNTKGQV